MLYRLFLILLFRLPFCHPSPNPLLSLSPPYQDYREVLDLIRHNILATDIAEHLRQMKAIQQMARGE